MYPWLEPKIEKANKTLMLAAQMSNDYYQKPLIITYSGGKDSDVMLQLAIDCLDHNDFEVINSHTTVDAPETVYYIRDKFKELNTMGIKATINYPRDENGNFISMWSLIVKNQMPPTRLARYCCKELKESKIPNRFVAVGVRESESVGRRGRNSFAFRGETKKDARFYTIEHVAEVYEQDKEWRQSHNAKPNDESVLECTFITKAKNNEDLICSPIYKWTDNDVWTYIEEKQMKYNPLYDKGFLRVGCIGCPLSSRRKYELEMYPKYKQNYINAFQRMLEARKAAGKDDVTGKVGLHKWINGEAVYRWWTQDDSIEGQMNINDFLTEENHEEI